VARGAAIDGNCDLIIKRPSGYAYIKMDNASILQCKNTSGAGKDIMTVWSDNNTYMGLQGKLLLRASNQTRVILDTDGGVLINSELKAAAGADLLDIKMPASATGTAMRTLSSAGAVQMSVAANGRDFILDTTTGTKIGTATNQKLGFYNVTPVVQQAYTAVSDPPTQAEVTAIRDALVNLGLMASS